MNFPKIISGGQTGVDRGALDGALACGVPCGGHCPEDRMAEDGVIDERYPVVPLVGAGYRKRTRQNVTDSDGTLIIYQGELNPKSGTALTVKFCQKLDKPYLLINQDDGVDLAVDKLLNFIKNHHLMVLNVGGSRASKAPTIHAFTQELIQKVIKNFKLS